MVILWLPTFWSLQNLTPLFFFPKIYDPPIFGTPPILKKMIALGMQFRCVCVIYVGDKLWPCFAMWASLHMYQSNSTTLVCFRILQLCLALDDTVVAAPVIAGFFFFFFFFFVIYNMLLHVYLGHLIICNFFSFTFWCFFNELMLSLNQLIFVLQTSTLLHNTCAPARVLLQYTRAPKLTDDAGF